MNLGLSRMSKMRQALEVFSDLKSLNITPNVHVYNALLWGKYASQVFCYVKRSCGLSTALFYFIWVTVDIRSCS